ncbi:MAG: response regulator [Deltaproteobacteria bacterium]|nr:response regulator [Deltaproteobacteria bacterium]
MDPKEGAGWAEVKHERLQGFRHTRLSLRRVFSEYAQDPPRLLQALAEALAEAVGGGCVAWVVSEDGEWLRPAGIHDLDPEFLDFVREVTAKEPVRVDATPLHRQLLARSEPLTLDPAALTSHLRNFRPEAEKALDAAGRRTVTLLPMKVEGRHLGHLALAHPAQSHYGPEFLEHVQELADHAALAVENARLLAEARRQVAQLSRAEEATREAQEALVRAQKLEAAGRLAAGLAHDFNNMLTVILCCADSLRLGLPGDPEAAEDVARIQGAGQRASALIQQLLAFSRQRVSQPRVVDLQQLVRDVHAMASRLLGESVTVTLHLGEDPREVWADPRHLEQALVNLLLNARDAMPSGGSLTVSLGSATPDQARSAQHPELAPGAWHTLSVADTGVGMDGATRARIFDPFFTTKPPGRGTGLGLSMVHGIIQQAGGAIDVTSEPGQGTTFALLLPPCPAASRRDSVRPAALAPASSRGTETVLLVDDNHELRALCRVLLQRQGYAVLEASNGVDAIAQSAAQASPPALLLTDVVLPGMNGRALADRLRASHPALRVLYMSGYQQDVIAHHGVLDEGIELLEKPFTAASLAQRVRQVLDG